MRSTEPPIALVDLPWSFWFPYVSSWRSVSLGRSAQSIGWSRVREVLWLFLLCGPCVLCGYAVLFLPQRTQRAQRVLGSDARWHGRPSRRFAAEWAGDF